jgi:hypothetical protein
MVDNCCKSGIILELFTGMLCLDDYDSTSQLDSWRQRIVFENMGLTGTDAMSCCSDAGLRRLSIISYFKLLTPSFLCTVEEALCSS